MRLKYNILMFLMFVPLSVHSNLYWMVPPFMGDVADLAPVAAYVKENKMQAATIMAATALVGYITQDYWYRPLKNFFRPQPCPVCTLNAVKENNNGKEESQDTLLANFQKSRARIYKPGDIKTRLKDVAGLDGAKAEMNDVMMYLKDPKRFHDMGAKVPKGVLLSGPPGNGKTLLAKAVAGEVDCPFLSVSASEFIEAIVGIGAARVRDLFAKAKELSPCIIFIDEFDALAKRRSSHSFGGGGDEQAQTLAQLLVMMDGFDAVKNPIIVLAATNRPEVLDPAVLRPGRFDRKVEINRPYIKDRFKILNVHLSHIKSDKDIDVQRIARATMGFSGAELAGLINDAAILAVNDHSTSVTMSHIDHAYDNLILGREVGGMDQIEFDLWETAVHEAGHAIGYVFLDDAYPLHKVTITPRGKALGLTCGLPKREQYSYKEDQLRAKIIVSLCGGLAEQAFSMGKSSGVSSDLKHAREVAYQMVAQYGMGEELKYMSYDDIESVLPNDVATKVHNEVQKIIDSCYQEAQQLIDQHKDQIQQLAELLMEKGTVYGNEVYKMFGLEAPDIDFSLV